MRILGLPIELWVFIGIGLLSFIQWLIKKAQTQQEITKARRLQQQREAEILRTGRDPVAERAAQLKAEQDRLRRMEAQPPQEDQAQQSSGEAQPQSIERELWPGGPVIVITQNGPTVRSPGGQGSQGGQATAPPLPAGKTPSMVRAERERQRQQLRERKQAAARARQAQQNSQRSSETTFEDANRRRAAALAQQQARFATQAAEIAEEDREARRRAAQANAQAAARNREESSPISAPREVVFVKPTAAWQWRRAFVTAEVLNSPISLRPNHFEELGGSSTR